MIEKLIENWLDKSVERTFQIPFCYMLIEKGFKIIHMTRHCGMELGKDVIAISPDGVPCAYQLKTAPSGRITLNQWNSGINTQVFNLVVNPIVHPSVDPAIRHRAFFVTNGGLDEEVSRAIDDLNRQWVSSGQGHLKLHSIVKGELFSMAKDLGENIWPSEFSDLKRILSLYLEDGTGILPKEDLSFLLENIFINSNKSRPSKAKCLRDIASAALLCSLVISKFSEKNNYLAEIEGWMIFIAYIFYMKERWRLPFNAIQKEFDIARKSIYNSLNHLCEELKTREHFVEGSPFLDPYFYDVRMTWLIALMSIFAIWRKSEDLTDDETDEFIKKFCLENEDKLFFYSEAVAPLLLSFFWYFRKVDATPKPDFFIRDLIQFICGTKLSTDRIQLANPYYGANDIFPYLLKIASVPLDDNFHANSFTLESFVHIFIRSNWKQMMKLLWPDITKITLSCFELEKPWDFFKWRNQRGTLINVIPKITQHWDELKELAFESNGSNIPESIKSYPVLLLLFLCVFPHRFNAEVVRWLDTKIRDI